MENCFVTQYQMYADNDNLPYLDSVKIKVAQNAVENRIVVGAVSTFRVFATGNCKMYLNNTLIQGNDIVMPSGGGDIYIRDKQEDIIVTIIGRSVLDTLLVYFYDFMGANIDQFKQEYMPKLTQLQVGNVTGNISSLAHNLLLNNLAFSESPLLEGDEKGLFNSLRQNGKTSGAIQYYRIHCPKLTNTIPYVGLDYRHRGMIHFMEDSVTYPNGWVVNIPITGKWYDSNDNEIPAP